MAYGAVSSGRSAGAGIRSTLKGDEAAEQGDEADEAKHIGASQLIPWVVSSERRNTLVVIRAQVARGDRDQASTDGQDWRSSRDEGLLSHRRRLGIEPLIAGAPAVGCCVDR